MQLPEVGETVRNALFIVLIVLCLLICISNASGPIIKCMPYSITPKDQIIYCGHKNDQYLYINTQNSVQVYALNDNMKLACVIKDGTHNWPYSNYIYKNTYIRITDKAVESVEIPSGKVKWHCKHLARGYLVDNSLYLVGERYIEEIDLEKGVTVCKVEVSHYAIKYIYSENDMLYIYYITNGFFGWGRRHMASCYLKRGLKKMYCVQMSDQFTFAFLYAARCGEYSVYNLFTETYCVKNNEYSKAENINIDSEILSMRMCMGYIIIVSRIGVHIFSAAMQEIEMYKYDEEVDDCVIGRDYIYIVCGGSLIKYKIRENEIVVEWVRKSENVSFIIKDRYNDCNYERELYFVDNNRARIYRLSLEAK